MLFTETVLNFSRWSFDPNSKNTSLTNIFSKLNILEFNTSFFMASFDIKSLFTNILLTKTLHIFVQNLYRNQSHVGNLTT